ncbi:BTB POZ domain-containing 9 [Pelobates cultripes]|uniref:BTB POZ domain-containing 9, partial n=1 Tax=Pelobates cultripes TaxID=61616 RepID=A0AAD1RGW0_PELCU|nr:BTB POZ domain-containing 9 [Pelobates cultripes]
MLINGEEYSDVTFILENKKFPAHRVILVARDEREDVILEFLRLAHRYGFPELKDSTSEHLWMILKIQKVCIIYYVANLHLLSKLTSTCCMFMDRNAQDVITSEGFLSLLKGALVFQALMQWSKHNPKKNHTEIMVAVRPPLMSLTQLLKVLKLLSPDSILMPSKQCCYHLRMCQHDRGIQLMLECLAEWRHQELRLGFWLHMSPAVLGCHCCSALYDRIDHTANKVFHCVHFESSGQTVTQKEDCNKESTSSNENHYMPQGIRAVNADSLQLLTDQNGRAI